MKKEIYLPLLCLLFFNLSFAQSYDDLISQAEKQYQDQAYEESTKTYLQAFDLKTDQSAGDLY
ncbi:MAG: hypothetical protein KDC34_20240, partial [Saprospiraceae bacterium]|nr:hypothetical protein [Saprospiraceae bacterium]